MDVSWDDLNDAQRAACEDLDGPVLVVGGPGSGKTTVVRHRYEQLVRNGIDPDNILLTTFSREAVAELKERIDTDTGDGTNIGTIHSIFYKIVRDYYDALGYTTANLNLYQDGEVRALLEEVVTEMTHGKPSGQVLDDTVRFYETNLRRIRANGMTPADLEDAMRDGSIAFRHLLADRRLDTIDGAEARAPAVYREFLDRLYDRNAIDYTGMQQKAWIVLQNNADALQHYRDTYRYLIVDEAQDLNYVQWQLIRLIGAEHENICLVGDDCQNIYAWRGSDHRYLHLFRDQFDATTYTLDRNYRGTQQLVDAVNTFMGHLDDVEHKDLVSDTGRMPQSDGFPRIDAYDNVHLERNNVVGTIHELVDGRYDPGEVAILLRTRGKNNARIDAYRDMLAGLQLDPADSRGVSFLNRREVTWVLTYLKAYLNPDDDIVVQNVLRRQPGIDTDSLATLQQEKPADTSLHEYVMDLTPLHASIIAPEQLKTIQDTLQFVRSLDDADNMVEQIYEESGLKQRIPDWGGDTETRRMNIDSLQAAMAEYDQSRTGVARFFDRITNTAATDDETGVTVTTMHGAKGKEWDVVFIPEATSDNLPHPMAETAEEEERLFYVALSRARERCYISYHGEPSPFVEYLQE